MPNSKMILFAWATPAFVPGSPVDHTWVTDFDNRITPYPTVSAVAAAGKHNWFCWGSYHAAGGTPVLADGLLLSHAGMLATAICLVQPNADSRHVAGAQGTIFSYGLDGVCHQLANQVLYACGLPATRVTNARGYGASSFLYGDYGLQHTAWAAKIGSCAHKPKATVSRAKSKMGVATKAGGATTMGDDSMPDEFELRARRALEQTDGDRLAALLALRDGARRAATTMIARREAIDAKTLNARNQALIDEAAKLLTREQFESIFGHAPDARINLVEDGSKTR